VDELILGDREGKAPERRATAERAVVALKELNVASVSGGGDRDHKVIHVGDHNSFGDHGV